MCFDKVIKALIVLVFLETVVALGILIAWSIL